MLNLKPTCIYTNTLKSTRIPEGFMLLQDTREQRPLFKDTRPYVTAATLRYGDYTILGYESKFAIERKQLGDFYAYIGRQRRHTTRKMQEFKEMVVGGGWAGLVVEASEADLLTGYIMSKVPPEVARQAIVSFEIRYGVHVYYSRSRRDIARWVLDRAIKFYRIQQEDVSA